MSAPPIDDRRLSNAALAASIAVKAALRTAGSSKGAPTPNVAEIAGEAATSQGARPVEAAVISLELERLSREFEPDDLPREEIVRDVAAAAGAATTNASGATDEVGRPVTGQSPPVDANKLYCALAQVREWFPLGKLARDLGLEDPATLSGQLAPLVSDGYVRIENEHVWVTERGHRFLEYARLT